MKENLFYQFAEDAASPTTSSPRQNPDAPEYKFEGFTVVINEKITLTPVQRHKKKKHG